LWWVKALIAPLWAFKDLPAALPDHVVIEPSDAPVYIFESTT